MADNRKLLVGPLGVESSDGILNINNNLLSNLAAPLNALDGANKEYVDQADSALDARLDVLEIYKEDQIIYVSKNGNDSTGTGGQHKPFLTLTAALVAITDASASKRYVIKVSAGNYVEASLPLKANVFIVGDSMRTVRITGAVSMASDFSGSADNRSGFANVTLLSACDFNWQTVTSAAGKIYCENVLFNTTVNLYGHTNAIAQAQFNNCQFYGDVTNSGINVGVANNNLHYAKITLNQHPNGGMATIWSARGGSCSNMVINAAVNDFNRRCSAFAYSFWMDALSVDGPSAYIDVTDSSVPNEAITVANGGNVVYVNTTLPAVNNTRNIGGPGKQYLFNFSHVYASSESDLYVISMGNDYAAANAGRSIFVEADSYGLTSDVNGGDINLTTAATSGTGVRGKIKLSGREVDVDAKKIVNAAAGVADNDVVIMSQYNDLDGYAQDLRSDLDDLDGYAQDTRSDLDQEILDREAAVNGLGDDFALDEFTVDSTMISNGYIDLSAKAFVNSMVMSIGRLMFFGNGVDYSVSVVGGVTRLSFAGDLLPGQAEALEVGEKIKVRYLKDLR